MSSSGKRKSRSKSGMLTGLMIVSTGLIAGFQGFDLAVSDQMTANSNQEQTPQIVATRSHIAIDRQVNALDKLINDSLKQNRQAPAPQRLNHLKRNSEPQSEPAKPVTQTGPTINRALKRDRGQLNDNSYRDALNSIQQAAKQAAKPKLADKKVQPKPAKPLVAKAAPTRPILFADSADIALFAADMPLPAKLVFSGTQGRRMPSLPARYARGQNGSPLVPRTFRTGKTFGGLAEHEFQKRERRCMTTALYFEARSEPETGQIAVGQVVMNRVRSPDYPDTICGVIYQGSHRRTGCQFSFTCDGKIDKPNNKGQWKRSKRLANQILVGQTWLKSIGHATHYHADYVAPRWRRKMRRLKKIGRHIFYKAPKVSVTETYPRYMSGKRS
ncbi:MAG: cell wall hydrolase [bacterium]|nr:cell wall hydrolase [bacterium]